MTMRATITVGLLSLAMVPALGQTAPDTYWVQFTDKANTPFTLDQPEAFLSARTIAKRQLHGIGFDERDLPVDPSYVTGVLAIGEVELVNRSKWFNAITIRTTDPQVLSDIQQLPFVSNVRGVSRYVRSATEELTTPVLGQARGGEPEDYGASWTQISMLNGQYLHQAEAKGQGMLIGVLDSGFDQANQLAAFADLNAREGVLLTRDMVNHDGDVYADHWHGRSVLSCMAGLLPGYLQGTAPAADYVLVRTEEAATEFIVEEDNWVAGAELCDSIGCDVLNTSLGYTTFEDSLTDHVYADLDGETTRISIAAGIASQKGMIPVTSAGNSGQNEWRSIGAPADAFDILAVGAVGAAAEHAPFSSFGPSADGRVKPDVCAMGWGAIGLRIQGDSIAPLNGTSFASPILAGLVACLWQLHPERTASEVMQAVRESASLFASPNDSLGYGIPDFLVADDLLTQLSTSKPFPNAASALVLHPVPALDRISFYLAGTSGPVRAEVLDLHGRIVRTDRITLQDGKGEFTELTGLNAGTYLLRIGSANGTLYGRFVKQ